MSKPSRDPQKLSGSSRRQGWVDRGTRDGDRLRRPTAERKLRSGAGSNGLRMLTRQKAEPLLGMKLTLLRSGHRKGGRSCRALGLEAHMQGHIQQHEWLLLLQIMFVWDYFQCK